MARINSRRDREMLILGVIIAVILLLAVVLVLRVAGINAAKAPAERQTGEEAAAAFAPADPSAQGAYLYFEPLETRVPRAGATLAPMAEPTPTPEPTSAPTPEITPVPFEYLPIFQQANLSDKRIAITVDDCYQLENLKTIIRVAYQSDARLTLFPVGEAILTGDMAEVLKTCVFRLDYEIENHTWSHARIFRLPEEEMAAEIWKQRQAVSQALGVNYQEHFFRLMGGDGMYDQRTHNYLKQLGFRGIAYWSYSGSNADLEQIKATLRPGMVYLFHTTDEDTEKLKKFIPYCASKGYSLVTMNELFGLPANEMADISTLEAEMPAPRPYAAEYHDERRDDYSWVIVRIQERLYELGYLSDGAKSALDGSVADGVYGESTEAAIAAFQRANGLPVTGVADPETQRLLLDGSPSGVE